MQSKSQKAEISDASGVQGVSGLAAIRRYVAMRKAMPLIGLGDSVHHIHGSTEFDAELRLSDLVRAVNSHDALVNSLDELLNYSGGADSALEDGYVTERARAALASSREVRS